MPKEQSGIRERQNTRLKEPHRYKVIIHNDDFTTMEFVVMVLMRVFWKSEEYTKLVVLLWVFTVMILPFQKWQRRPKWPARKAFLYD